MLILYLDDIRNPKNKNCIIARTYEQAQELILSNNQFDEWSFDHDLGAEKSGYDLLKWAAEYALSKWPKGKVISHSANPIGRENMEYFIKNVEQQLLT